MIPSEFLWLDELPLSPNGKVDRKALPEPDWGRERAPRPVSATSSPAQEILTQLWSDVLGLEHVAPTDDFFDLGGHSLLATRLISTVRKAFNVEMSLRTVFEAPKLAGMAGRIEELQRSGGPPPPPFERVPRHGDLPLSFAQQRLWFLDQLEPGSSAYSVPAALRLEGELHVPALAGALGEIVRRHEILRTVFPAVDGEGVQRVLPPGPVQPVVVDLTSLPSGAREAAARQQVVTEAWRPFDLARGPLLRVTLLRMSPREHLTVFVLHHIVSDGWSTGILVRELAALYDAYRKGRVSPLSELPYQYVDYAAWQRKWLSGETLERKVGYWKRQLVGAPPVLELPLDRPRPAVQTYRGAVRVRQHSEKLSDELRAFSRREGVTLFMTLFAAFVTLLARISRQWDVTVGTPVAGRDRLETEGLIGFLVNTLALRPDLSGDPSFRDLLTRVREVALSAHAHQEVPFERLVEELAPDRNLSHSPLFQVMFVLQNVPQEPLELPGLVIRPLDADHRTAKFDLTLSVEDGDRRLLSSLEFATDLFDTSTGERLLREVETLLQSAVADPDRSIANLELLGPVERHQILVQWNDSAARYPWSEPWHRLFVDQVAARPDAVAVSCEGGGLSFAELDRRSDGLARALAQRGAGPEVVVPLLGERGLDFLTAVVAILKTGAAYLPMEPVHPPARHAQVLTGSATTMAVATEERFRRVLEEATDLIGGSRPHLMDLSMLRSEAETAPPIGDPEARPEELAYVIYTSGSTGVPKGVMIDHRGFLNHLYVMLADLAMEPADVLAQTASQCSDISVWQFLAPLAVGCRVEIFRDEVVQDASRLLEQIEATGVTLLETVPSVLRVLLDDVRRRKGRGLSPPLAALRMVLPCGEALPPELARGWLEEYPDLQLLNAYGPAEASDDVSFHAICEPPEPGMMHIPIGRPVGNLTLRVLDDRGGPVPVGVAGELCMGGTGVGRGYLRAPAKTAAVFVPDAFVEEPGARMYRSGDLARYLADGTLEFLGRMDHMVKVRGFRIELGEIEAVLSDHPEVGMAVVVARDEPTGDRQLVAYVVPESGGSPSPGELQDFLRSRLPDYMVPQLFATVDDLPLSISGKVDRKRLPEVVEVRTDAHGGYVAPRSLTEEVLAGIWSRLLPVDRVGVEDNFFVLGGHSLLAARLISRAREAFRVELSLRSLFEEPTVAGLARNVEDLRWRGAAKSAGEIERIPRDRELPLSFAQQRLWFLDHLQPGDPSYNVADAIRVQGELAHETLAQVLTEVVRRHEVLRTTFVNVRGRAVQRINPPSPVELPQVDLSGLPEEEAEGIAEDLSAEAARRLFDLATGPLFRVRVIVLSPERRVVPFTMHHIVSDGWSGGILVGEVTELYRAFDEGRPSVLPELPIQYVDYAAWQRRWLSGPVLEEELSFWRRQLEALPPALELPLDRPRPRERAFRRSAAVPLRLSADLSLRLRDLGREEGATTFMVLLAGLEILLHRYTGETDFAVGTPVAGRNRLELEPLIGFLLNTLVLRGDLSGKPTFLDLLARTREVALDAHAHQDLPFEKLVEELAPDRDLSQSALFQVLFVLQNTPREALEIQGLTMTPVDADTSATKFDLTLAAEDEGERLSLVLEYDADLFDSTTARRMIGHFEQLLSEAAQAPERRISELSALASSERHQLLVEYNDTFHPFLESDLLSVFTAQVERTPDAVAVVAGTACTTFGELDRRSEELAGRLRKLGVGPERRVGLMAGRSPEMVNALLAILKTGGAYVPIDPRFPKDRREFLLEDAGIQVLVVEDHPSAETGETRAVSAGLRLVPNGGDSARETPPCCPAPGSAAYVIYTSGSTGRPKGVVVEHRQVVNYLRGMVRGAGLPVGGSYAAVQPLAVDSSVTALYPPLLFGGTLHLIHEELALEAGAFAAYLRDRPIDVLKIAPSHLAALQRAAGDGAVLPRRLLVIGGEPSRGEWAMQLPGAAPDCRVFNHYGPTEATVGSLVQPISGEPVRTRSGTVPIGRPLPNTGAVVLDPRMSPVPVGVLGELFLGGASLARGYLSRPGLTAERFVPDPHGARGGRLYRTGDQVRRLADGAIEFVGRLDHQVKIRGFRVELGEIETVLSRHPGVQEVVVVPHRREGTDGLVAYVVAEDDIVPERLREHLQERLPDLMVPGSWMLLPALPRTRHGKIDRSALPHPEPLAKAERPGYVEPRTYEERRLAAIWGEVLRVDRVGATDNFFALGGDSILSIEVVARAVAAGLSITPRQVFEHQTVAELAQVVGTALRVEAEQGAVTGPIPLTPSQRRFFEHHVKRPEHYNQVLLLSIREALEPPALASAVEHLARHHDVLRSRFAERDGTWRQWVAEPGAGSPLMRVDLSRLDEPDLAAAVESASYQAQRSLDLARGPLFRVAFFHLGEGRPDRLLLLFHHLIVDGVSWRILLVDLEEAYRLLAAGEEPKLPPKTTSFQRWAKGLEADAATEARQAEAGYWLDAVPAEVVPLPREASGDASVRGAEVLTVQLDPEATDVLLRELPRKLRTRVDDALVTAFAWTLGNWADGRTLLLELETHGREESVVEGVDLSRTVGWFTAHFPAFLDLQGCSDLLDGLKRVKEQLRNVPDRGVGYGLLRYLTPDPELRRRLAVKPRPELRFNYLGQLDQALSRDSAFRLAREAAGPAEAPEEERRHILEVDASVLDGRLRMEWTFSPGIHLRTTVEALAAAVAEGLRELVDRTKKPETGDAAVPSDFPLADLSEEEFGRISVLIDEVDDESAVTS
ncbi:MAG: amino acid adenylation domain-containing protein [bacterium]